MKSIHPKSFSQAHQESFVLNVLQNKRMGTYIEIGGYHGTSLSNTYILESEFDWKGISIEIDSRLVRRYNRIRKNKCIRANAVTLDYAKHVDLLGDDGVIDYLQVDIEPPLQSFQALIQVLDSGLTFRVITFEHDLYSNPANQKTRDFSREYLRSFGYSLIAADVRFNGDPFEDWYVHPDFVEEDLYTGFISKNQESSDLFDK
jgi:hypothetical protein